MHQTPPNAATYVRLEQIVPSPEVSQVQADANRQAGRYPVRPRPASPGLIPISKATWWRWVKEGRAPQPVKIGPQVTAWRLDEVLALTERV